MAELDIDELARRLAANAGISWEMLSNYPGYARNIWRDKAQMMLWTLAARDRVAASGPELGSHQSRSG